MLNAVAVRLEYEEDSHVRWLVVVTLGNHLALFSEMLKMVVTRLKNKVSYVRESVERVLRRYSALLEEVREIVAVLLEYKS